MVLWHSDLRVSWQTQWLSLLLHGLVAAAVLFLPWPLAWTPVWLLLVSLVVFDSVRSQRRINASHGELQLLTENRVKWQEAEWALAGQPWMLKYGILLRLRRISGGRKHHLWLAADSMDQKAWRDLRRLLNQHGDT